MYKRKFKTNIGIVGLKSKRRLEDAGAMPDTEAKAFVDSIYEMLAKLDSKPLGHQLLTAIQSTMKPVIIYCDDQSGKGSAAIPYPGTASNEVGRFVKLRQIPANAVTALQKVDSTFVPPTMASYGALFHRTLERSKMNRDIVAAILGITRDDLDEIELGQKQLPPEAYHRFAMALYDFLDPGDGCSVGLRFDPTQAEGTDTPLIILGHELVHTWRMVAGMRIFLGGWEEEAMTTGIPPFMSMKYTENKLRIEQGLPLRTKYTDMCGTAHYQMITQLADGKGIWPEHVRAWEEWKKANPKLAEKKIKLKKNSVFSSPIRNIFGR